MKVNEVMKERLRYRLVCTGDEIFTSEKREPFKVDHNCEAADLDASCSPCGGTPG